MTIEQLANYKSIQFFITLIHATAIIDKLPHACYTKKSISNILNKIQMENQPESGYCLLKMENINDIFTNSTVSGQCKISSCSLPGFWLWWL